MKDIKKISKKGFSAEYWKKNYSTPEEMDCICNVNAHISYLKSIFDVEQIKLQNAVDLGFGLGYFSKCLIENLKLKRLDAVEPSSYIFNDGKKRIISKKHKKLEVNFVNTDMISWLNNCKNRLDIYDIGICTSVFQYIKDHELDLCIELLSQTCRYVYLTVPTDLELMRQRDDADFCDEYAISRSQDFYYQKFSKSFTFVSSRLIESKKFFDDQTTPLTDLLFRF